MKKNVLIIAASSGERWGDLEKAILSRGMSLVRVKSLKEALYRLENEVFSAIVFEDDAVGAHQREFAEQLRSRPFGLTTPILVLGTTVQPKERTLLTSVLDQYFPDPTEPETIAEFLAETHELRRQKAKRGRIGGAVSVPRILFQASRFRMSGAVVLERVEEKCVIYLEQGHVVFASSNRDENRFGEFLVGRGIISSDQLLHAISVMQRSHKRLGRVLVDEGFLKPQVLQTLLQSQIKHIVFTVFDWQEGEFFVLFDEQCERDNAIARVEVPPLILEGVRFKFTEPQLEREFAPLDARVSLSTSLEEIQKRMHLGKNETDFLRLAGQGRPIEELLNLNSFSRLESLKLLYGFRVLGFLSFERGVYAPAKAIPGRDERKRAVVELFGAKDDAAPEAPPKAVAAPKPRSWKLGYLVGAGSMAVALSVFLVFVTIFGTETSEEGQTLERDSLAANPAARVEIAKVELPTPAPIAEPAATPSSVPVAAPAAPAAPEKARSADPTPAPAPTERPSAALLAQAQQQKKQGRLNDAVATYRKVLGGEPANVEAMVLLGDLLFELDRPAEAMDVLLRAKKLAPSDARPYLSLGTIYLMRNQRNEARSHYEAYLSLVRPDTSNRQRIVEVRRILENFDAGP